MLFWIVFFAVYAVVLSVAPVDVSAGLESDPSGAPLVAGFLGGIVSAVGKGVKAIGSVTQKLAPALALIPGVGTVAATAAGLAGSVQEKLGSWASGLNQSQSVQYQSGTGASMQVGIRPVVDNRLDQGNVKPPSLFDGPLPWILLGTGGLLVLFMALKK